MISRWIPAGAALAAIFVFRMAGQRPEQPNIQNLAGKILTVNGPIEPSRLGQTLMHEHIFIDFQNPSPAPIPSRPADAERYLQPLTLANLGAVRQGASLRENPFLGDFEESLAEIREFKNRGGDAIVDVSNIGLGRDPRALQRVSRASGLQVVMGAGWYQKQFHPLDMDQRTVEKLTEAIVRDVTQGVDGTGIRSGIIGEVGINGNPLTPNEVKSTRASARASRLTGAPITFHVGGFREEKFQVLDVVASEGVDLSSVVMGHSSSVSNDVPFMKRLLARGVFIEFDYMGVSGGPGALLGPVNDSVVARGIAELVKAGYADRIVLAHDVCTKIQLKKYGGQGFTYISDYFLPELSRLGVSDADIHKIMVDNPRRALTFVAPRPQVQTSAVSAAR
jgi:phosphotriesterase-related protein